MMVILAIETTTPAGGIAICKDGKVIYEEYLIQKITHSEYILPRLDAILQHLEIKRNDLSAVAVSIGPGSFTGCRFGLATAKGICVGLQIPLIAFNTLEILAANMYSCGHKIVPIIDSRMSEVYLAVYDGSINQVLAPNCLKYQHIIDYLEKDCICVGDTHLLPLDVFDIPINIALPHQNIISASAMFSLIKHRKIDFVYDEEVINNLLPFYLREVTK